MYGVRLTSGGDVADPTEACSLCGLAITEGEAMWPVLCGSSHGFHTNCLLTMKRIRASPRCPTCARPMVFPLDPEDHGTARPVPERAPPLPRLPTPLSQVSRQSKDWIAAVCRSQRVDIDDGVDRVATGVLVRLVDALLQLQTIEEVTVDTLHAKVDTGLALQYVIDRVVQLRLLRSNMGPVGASAMYSRLWTSTQLRVLVVADSFVTPELGGVLTFCIFLENVEFQKAPVDSATDYATLLDRWQGGRRAILTIHDFEQLAGVLSIARAARKSLRIHKCSHRAVLVALGELCRNRQCRRLSLNVITIPPSVSASLAMLAHSLTDLFIDMDREDAAALGVIADGVADSHSIEQFSVYYNVKDRDQWEQRLPRVSASLRRSKSLLIYHVNGITYVGGVRRG